MAVLDQNNIALIKRTRAGEVYYVFPGGGIENNESPVEATKREVFEELGILIDIKELFTNFVYNGVQYFYYADIIGGKFGTGKGEKFTNSNRNRGLYEPVWIPLNNFSSLDVRPKVVAIKLMGSFI